MYRYILGLLLLVFKISVLFGTYVSNKDYVVSKVNSLENIVIEQTKRLATLSESCERQKMTSAREKMLEEALSVSIARQEVFLTRINELEEELAASIVGQAQTLTRMKQLENELNAFTLLQSRVLLQIRDLEKKMSDMATLTEAKSRGNVDFVFKVHSMLYFSFCTTLQHCKYIICIK